jgi:hypothetical protein
LGIPDDELERYVTEAQDRLTGLRLSVLARIDEWELIFSQYFSYSEVWGEHPRGLTDRELLEARLAYDEWSKLDRAYQNWEKRGTDRPFDRAEYIQKRREEIVG